MRYLPKPYIRRELYKSLWLVKTRSTYPGFGISLRVQGPNTHILSQIVTYISTMRNLST